MPRAPHIVRLEERSRLPTAAGGDIYTDLALGEHTNSSYYAVHAIVPSGGGPPAHIHTREDEAFYVIRGELVFLLGDEELTAQAGTFLNVPTGTKHRFRNKAPGEAEMIFWFAPAGIEGLFRELTQQPQDIEAIGQRYGVEYFLE